jgi:peptidyl-prolyl cis-trans isomerase B (cyclophilin B)
MARGPDRNSASSQFYICDSAVNSLDGNYAVFGKVVEGMDVVHAIASVPTGAGDRPVDPPKLLSVSIQ